MNEQLVDRIRNCPNLPTLPTIAVEVLELAQRPDADIAEIAKTISRDPALSSKILRTVNSSFYGRSHHVATISHALVILGLQSVKTLVLGFSLVTNLMHNKSRGFRHIPYWKRSIYAATAARSIAARVGVVQQEEAFLAALLADIGMLVLDLVMGQAYSDAIAAAASHADLPAIERSTLGMTHAEVAGVLAQQWRLPPVLAVPMACHHSPDSAQDPSLRKLADIVGLGGRCADIFVDDQAAGAIADVRRKLNAEHGLPEADCDALLADIGRRTREVANLFEINIGSPQEFEAILKKATETLVEITLQTQQQNQQLLEQAKKDGLTGLANRATFDQFLAAQFDAAVHAAKPLALLLMDLDRFKSINDKHGHQAGDSVLRAVARLLSSAARPQDLAARFGGEELVLVLPGTPRDVAAAIAETIRRAIAARPVIHERLKIPVTASIGVAGYEPGGPLRSPAHLLKAADLAVYHAKHAGRNCVKIFNLKPQPCASSTLPECASEATPVPTTADSTSPGAQTCAPAA
ncbi:sensor domain-containing diguanylate cyclase [Fontivita pretiosa]|uniref:sensor domain-containing diguanylate cyclase n=1 Tax=Fontivita pretiosa TaxID=2989684 RepID=UPI003D186D97